MFSTAEVRLNKKREESVRKKAGEGKKMKKLHQWVQNVVLV